MIKDDNTRQAEFLEVQIWFVVRSTSASKQDIKFHVVMSPEETIDFLKKYVKQSALDKLGTGDS